MENDKERHIQEEILKTIKEGISPIDVLQDEDAATYQMLFDVLSEEDELNIPRDFAEIVTAKARKRTRLSEVFHSISFYGLPVIFLVTLSFASLFFASKEFFITLLHFIRIYGNYIIFAVVIIVLVQLADKWLVKKKTYHFN